MTSLPTVPDTRYEIEYHSDKFTKWVLSMCASLIASGVVALWSMSNHVAQLEERMAGWTRSMTEQITQLQITNAEQTKMYEAIAIRQREIEQHTYRDINRNINRIDDILRRLDRLERLQLEQRPRHP